jgi:hypothetical protein
LHCGAEDPGVHTAPHCPAVTGPLTHCPEALHVCGVALLLPLHCVAPGVHAVHAPHVQLPSQTWIPPFRQLSIEPGAHCPWLVHADHADHMAVLPSQVRVRVPQLPQVWLAAPMHI